MGGSANRGRDTHGGLEGDRFFFRCAGTIRPRTEIPGGKAILMKDGFFFRQEPGALDRFAVKKANR
jgi:hypothetical protein